MCKEVACMCRVSENNRQQANYPRVMYTNEFSPILLFLSVVFHSAILSLEFILFWSTCGFFFLQIPVTSLAGQKTLQLSK